MDTLAEGKFKKLIKLASQPVKSWGKRAKSAGSASSTDKKTRPRNAGDTSEKRRDTSR